MIYLYSFLYNVSIVSAYCNEYSKYKVRLLGMTYGAVALNLENPSFQSNWTK